MRFDHDGLTTIYECELHPLETLEVPPDGVHPAEC